MAALEQFTKGVIKKMLSENYPHLEIPAVVYARVSSRKQLDDTYEVSELQITNVSEALTFQASITAHWYEYTLQVLDCFGNPDTEFPAIPGVRSKLQLQASAVVAVGLAFGELTPVIIGEVIL